MEMETGISLKMSFDDADKDQVANFFKSLENLEEGPQIKGISKEQFFKSYNRLKKNGKKKRSIS